MSPLAKLVIGAATALTFASFAYRANAEQPTGSTWPATVVKFEDLRPLTDFELRIPGAVRKGRVTGPAILRVHVTADGTVARTALMESCGNQDLDEASIHAMREMRFKPHTFGGVPTDVTLVAPVHVPVRWGRER